MRRSIALFLSAGLFGIMAASGAQAVVKKPSEETYCDRQVKACKENCRGEPLCMTHCNYYCGSRFPLSQGAIEKSAPAKPAQTAPQQ